MLDQPIFLEKQKQKYWGMETIFNHSFGMRLKMEKKDSDLELEDQPLPIGQNESMDQVTGAECRGWKAMRQVFKRHFLSSIRENIDFKSVDWSEIPEDVRCKLREVIRVNPRFGPELGMIPEGLIYPTGETFSKAVARKTKEQTWTKSGEGLSGFLTQWR